ncbi:MAG: IS630 family transposase [Bacteroidales bacterium]|nr:IS630 family transposase [Bacteroidales bacterium]
MTATQHSIKTTAKLCNCSYRTVRTWTRRVLKQFEKLGINHVNEDFIQHLLLEALADRERSGRPDIYTAEQLCRIIKLATEEPENYDYPISDWSVRELTMEVNKQGIATAISERTVARILNSADLKPHKDRYWLNANKKSGDFDERVPEVCNIYQNAQAFNNLNIRVASIDEKTGIQALERIAPDKKAMPGNPKKREVEYKRHGTLCLIPSFDVATGRIIEYSIGKTRNELDFLEQVTKTINSDPDARWIFIADQLNTHKSESLVRMIAMVEGISPQKLGQKGKFGILKNLKTRMEFIESKEHRIRFFYTPKHCSWLNQIEIWFGIITRKLLRKLSCESLEKLEEKIIEFINYFNATMSKPFKWTYQGKILKA